MPESRGPFCNRGKKRNGRLGEKFPVFPTQSNLIPIQTFHIIIDNLDYMHGTRRFLYSKLLCSAFPITDRYATIGYCCALIATCSCWNVPSLCPRCRISKAKSNQATAWFVLKLQFRSVYMRWAKIQCQLSKRARCELLFQNQWKAYVYHKSDTKNHRI